MDASAHMSVAPAVRRTGWGRVPASRRVADNAMKLACLAVTAMGVCVLGWILAMLAVEGTRGLSPARFTDPTPGPGSEGGGLGNAILGSLVLTGLGIAVATRSGCWPGPTSPN